MKNVTKNFKFSTIAGLLGVALLTAACSSTSMKNPDMAPMKPAEVSLSGAQEVPANQSSATGTSSIMVAPDKSVSGKVTVSGMTATAAHIHEAAAGKNGPVVVPLAKASDNTFTVAPNTKLTDAQYASFLAGNLYINVHSAANPGGEVRVQLKGN